ncbi:hypothetical protein NL676_010896 [Syzygium grande]|nr:hypothetical protein NL676_010896 [Syzygium grande]
MRSGPSRRTDSGRHAETHAADGALRADKNREIGDGKDHRAFKIRQFRFTSSFSPTPEPEGRIPLVQSRNAASRNIRRDELVAASLVTEDTIGLGGAMSVSRGSSIPTVELESFVYGGCACREEEAGSIEKKTSVL